MSKTDDEDEEYCHECAQCANERDCSDPEWQAIEGSGGLWFCSQECADSYAAMEDLDRNDGRPSPDTVNEDDPREDR